MNSSCATRSSPGMRLEHAEVRRVAQLELALRGGCLRG